MVLLCVMLGWSRAAVIDVDNNFEALNNFNGTAHCMQALHDSGRALRGAFGTDACTRRGGGPGVGYDIRFASQNAIYWAIRSLSTPPFSVCLHTVKSFAVFHRHTEKTSKKGYNDQQNLRKRWKAVISTAEGGSEK